MAATGASADGDAAYVEHPLLVDGIVERRLYQLDLAATARGDHALVCLPTGLGKTTVSLLVTAERLHAFGVQPDGTVGEPPEADGAAATTAAPTDHDSDVAEPRALFLAPTKPLVSQHAAFYREALALPDDAVGVFTGEVSPDERADLWADSRVVIATPQVVENDLIGGRIDLRDVVHLTFDECHRASGDYAYNFIAERYHDSARAPLVTGMSASPGGDEDAITTVCGNLGLRAIAVKTEEDDDVAAHTHETTVEWERVDLPDELRDVRDALDEVIAERLETLRDCGVTRKTDTDLSQTDLNRIRGRLQELIDQGDGDGYQGMSAHAEIMKLRRAKVLAGTQSVEALDRYFERQSEAARSSGASKATQRLVSDPRVRRAMRAVETYEDRHPKYERARAILAEELGVGDGERAIVFTESRDTAEALTEFLDEDFDARRFVGQGDKDGSDGMTQTQQAETLDAFRAGEFEVLVSTSVAEEGLDVPEVDLVLFYEPVPTAIRAVQRKGRTGRGAAGRVVVLLAEDTRDEAYFWIAKRREEEMADELHRLQDVAAELTAQSEIAAPPAVPDAAAGDDARADGDRGADDDGEAAADPAWAVPADEGAASGDRPDGDASADQAAADGGGDPTASAEDGQSGLGAFAGGGDAAESAAGAAADTGGSDTTDDAQDEGDAGASDDGDVDPDEVPTPDAESGVEVVIDQREMEGGIARDLARRETIETRLETLDVGDYVLSDRVAVERKSVADFLDTLLGGDRSLFEQTADMARAYGRPIVVVEGEDLYGERNVHPNAIRGALASLAVDWGASVLRTTDANDTAALLATIAEREQDAADREARVHGEKATKTLAEQQEYVVSSIADIGPITARALLADLGSVEAVLTADRDRLLEVEGVGEVTADRIREVVGESYAPD
jgi:ERCC4-related helicase/ERCC4-type nuclease